jgi:hypothetical protein
MTSTSSAAAQHLQLDWTSLIFGTYDRQTIDSAVGDLTWQALRVSLLGTPHAEKFEALRAYLAAPDLNVEQLNRRRVQVTNYVYALRRGGLIP